MSPPAFIIPENLSFEYDVSMIDLEIHNVRVGDTVYVSEVFRDYAIYDLHITSGMITRYGVVLLKLPDAVSTVSIAVGSNKMKTFHTFLDLQPSSRNVCVVRREPDPLLTDSPTEEPKLCPEMSKLAARLGLTGGDG